jgi:superfamily II DNA/RNA helicase
LKTTSVAGTTFSALGLSPKVEAAIAAAGYTTPTPIQAAAIPVAITGRDVLGIAQTGTGKTASFVLPMITRLETGRARARMPRSLILAPTRELAAQVEQSFEKYGTNNKLSVALLIGGVSMDEQVKKLDRGVDVLIATPGRLLDHFQRGRVMLMGVEILVIDEADRMLDMGFIPDIEKICKLLPPRRQTLFFSATMPQEITRLADQFLRDPARVEVAKPATTAKTITQKFHYCGAAEDWTKREVLRSLIRENNVKNAIIFCNRKRDVAILVKSLLKHGFNAGALHGDMDQRSRTETLDKFRSGAITLLAASDVAARGLDIPDVSHIFNFDLPWQSDDYVHRIGRTGRAGKQGISYSIVTSEDLKLLKDIERMLGEPIQWTGAAPTEQDYANAGKRRRGRGGRGATESRRGQDHNRRHAPSAPSTRRPAPHQTADERFVLAPEPRIPGSSPQPQIEPRAERTHARQTPARAEPDRSTPQRRDAHGPHQRKSEQTPPRQAPQAPQTSPSRAHQPKREKAPQGSPVGFEDNVPAFLRRSSRPTRAANDDH